MTAAGTAAPLASRRVADVVTAVLDGERVRRGTVSVTFLSSARMRALHRRAFGTSRLTDVIAFPLAHRHVVVGDIYICPTEARRNARGAGVAPGEEVVRLVVHGTLHVLGHRHPEGSGRTRSRMWRQQERYVRAMTRRRR